MKERDSNIELLRLFCMFLIVWVHFTGYCIFNCSQLFPKMLGFQRMFPHLIHGISWCAVNTFIIISGYYGIHPKAKSFFNLYLQCAFYAGILYLLHLYATGLPLNRWCIYNTIMPFSYHQNWWFIPQYVILFILSPILNKLIETLSKKEFLMSLLLMALVVFYFGHYRQRQFGFAEGGMNFINFIFLYCIGRYIALYYHSDKSIISQRWIYAGAYLISGLCMGLIEWYLDAFHITSWNMVLSCDYNHPLCVFAAICLFLFFRTLQFKNRVVNWFSASALSIYLLHNGSYSGKYLFDTITNTFDSPPISHS